MLRISGKVDTASLQRKLQAISQAVTPPLDVVRQSPHGSGAAQRSRLDQRPAHHFRTWKAEAAQPVFSEDRDLGRRVQVGWLEPGPTRYGRFVEARKPVVRPTVLPAVRQHRGAIRPRVEKGASPLQEELELGQLHDELRPIRSLPPRARTSPAMNSRLSGL